MVVHLEAVRMIICRDQVLLISVPQPLQPSHAVFPAPDSPLVQDLVFRFSQLFSKSM